MFLPWMIIMATGTFTDDTDDNHDNNNTPNTHHMISHTMFLIDNYRDALMEMVILITLMIIGYIKL